MDKFNIEMTARALLKIEQGQRMSAMEKSSFMAFIDSEIRGKFVPTKKETIKFCKFDTMILKETEAAAQSKDYTKIEKVIKYQRMKDYILSKYENGAQLR